MFKLIQVPRKGIYNNVNISKIPTSEIPAKYPENSVWHLVKIEWEKIEWKKQQIHTNTRNLHFVGNWEEIVNALHFQLNPQMSFNTKNLFIRNLICGEILLS